MPVWQVSCDTVGMLSKPLNVQQRKMVCTFFKYMYLVIC